MVIAVFCLLLSDLPWLWGTGVGLIALILLVTVYRSTWRSLYVNERVKADWSNEHSLAISAVRSPPSPLPNTENWYYGSDKNGSGCGLVAVALLVFGIPSLIFYVFHRTMAPFEIAALSFIFFLALTPIAYSLVKYYLYRQLDIRINKKIVPPGEKVRVLVKQPDKKPVDNLEVTLLSRVEHYGGEGSSYETLVAVPILELKDLKPERDGRVLDFEFQVPDWWPRIQNFPHFRISSNVITEIRLRQKYGNWPALTEHFPIEILEPAPSILDLHWPLGQMRGRLDWAGKKLSPAKRATLDALGNFLGYSIFGGFIFSVFTVNLPDNPSALLMAIWFLLLFIYFASVVCIPILIWRYTYKKEKQKLANNH